MKKLILLMFLVSVSLSATVSIVDMQKCYDEIHKVFPKREDWGKYMSTQWQNDLNDWATEEKIAIVMEAQTCWFFSQDADATEKLIAWLKKKYRK